MTRLQRLRSCFALATIRGKLVALFGPLHNWGAGEKPHPGTDLAASKHNSQ